MKECPCCLNKVEKLVEFDGDKMCRDCRAEEIERMQVDQYEQDCALEAMLDEDPESG